MYEKSFDYLLKNGNEVIIYGVLKRLHLARQMSDFEDLVEEGKLAFVVAYDEYVKKYQSYKMKSH
ncbi:MAG: hypothetical protein HDT50_02970 [Lactobacillus sp.]|nr:hypothetical protein [Lactobacillus sp.]